ncbi:MAG: hypothetical protein ACREBA_01015 [Nitrosotalea sp.]
MTRNETVYGHAVSCFHLPGQGPKRDLDSIITTKSRSAEHIRRASTLLKIALEQEK